MKFLRKSQFAFEYFSWENFSETCELSTPDIKHSELDKWKSGFKANKSFPRDNVREMDLEMKNLAERKVFNSQNAELSISLKIA